MSAPAKDARFPRNFPIPSIPRAGDYPTKTPRAMKITSSSEHDGNEPEVHALLGLRLHDRDSDFRPVRAKQVLAMGFAPHEGFLGFDRKLACVHLVRGFPIKKILAHADA